MSEPLPPGRRRRSPMTRGGRATLTADAIASAMLDRAGRCGFASVSMQDLAADLGVTVRALYRHVRDRQEVVDRAVELWLSGWPTPELDPTRWRESLRAYCDLHRAIARRYPRALLVSLDERVSDARVPAQRLIAPEQFLEFLAAVGLPLPDALFVHSDLTLRIYGFVLFVDYRADSGEPIADQYPVPQAWLDGHADLDVPLLRRARTEVDFDADAMFDRVTVEVINAVERLLCGPG
ncbi:TetR/AcrR family transcriptional regulator [Nocardia cyriacigeorgica]|uniref:TetR/AcrR family transcriptional regulator n=1 Tax=Nocardia cyriacigeorgica TaxID=135487 RepID=A0A6P1DDB2_9NOCA|nr:TetR/AcrR family transcriptional regulator [Nocardia cyriacigeorgica]NEW46790.1 TetR/AcrR family transcriptional regulator [Nocardia cyriacigeorgica]